MENTNQNTGGSLDAVGSTVQPMSSAGEPTFNPGALSDTPDPSSTTPAATVALAAPQESLWVHLFRHANIILAVLLVFAGTGLFVAVWLNRERGEVPTNAAADRFGTIEVPLKDLADADGLEFSAADRVVINGSLQTNGPFILTPSLQPSDAVAGQLYYDQTSNTLAYFNGEEFVAVTGADGVVKSLGGISGDIGLGPGLSVENGQLSVAANGVQSLQGQVGNLILNGGAGIGIDGLTITNTGVQSLQGQTGAVTLAAGNGIAIAGTTIDNTGVISVAAGSPNVSVSDDGSGNVTVSVTSGAGTVTSSGGTAGIIPVYTDDQNIEDSIVTQSGLTVTVSGDLAVVTGGLSLSNALTVDNGGIGTDSLAANGVLVGNGTDPITSVAAGSPGLCLVSTAGAPTWGACSGGGGVTSLNSLTGALNIANASGAGSTITLDNASTTAKGIASFNSADFTASGGNISLINTVTKQGNTFNSANQLVQLNGTGGLPALNGSLLTNLNASNIASGTLGDARLSANVALLNAAANFTVALQQGGNDVCTTAGNCAGLGQVVDSMNGLTGDLTLEGTAGQIDVNDNGTDTLTLSLDSAVTLQGNAFNGASQLVQLNASSQLPAVSGALLTTLNASALASGTVANARLVNSGALTVTAGNGLSGGGSVALGGSTSLSVAYGSTANTAVQGNTQITVTAGTNLNGGGTLTLGSGGSLTVNVADSPTFAGDAVVQGGDVTVGVANSQTGSLRLANGGSAFMGILQAADLGQATTYTLPDPGQTTADICLSTGNCAGAGGGITGSGTNNTIAKFTGVGTVGDSSITDDGTTVTTSADMVIQGGGLTLGTTTQAGSFVLHDGDGETITFGTSDVGTSYTLTLPTAVGAANQCLKAQNGTGALFWDDCEGGAGGSTGIASINSQTGPAITVAGTTNQVNVNSASNTITLSTPQNIHTGATPTFTGVNTNTITPSGALTIGATGQTAALQGSVVTLSSNGAGNDIVLTSADQIRLTGFNCTTSANGGLLTTDASGNLLCGDDDGGGSTPTFQSVYNNSNPATFTLNGTNDGLIINDAATPIGSSLFAVQNNDGTTSYLDVTSSGISVTGAGTFSGDLAVNGDDVTSSAATLNINAASAIALQDNTTVTGTINVSGAATLQSTLLVQGASVTVGGASQAGSLVLNDGAGQTGAVDVATLGQATTYTLPDPGQATVDICLSTGNCAGAGGGITGSGTANQLAKFTASGTIGDSSISDNGTTVTTSVDMAIQGGDLTVGTTGQLGSLVLHDGNGGQTTTLQSGNSTSNLTFILPTTAGNQFQCLKKSNTGNQLIWDDCEGGSGGVSGVTALNSLSGALTLAGTTNQITVSDNATDTLTLSLPQDIHTGATPTFGGLTLTNDLTVANGGTGASSFTANGVLYGNGSSALQVTAAPTAGQVLLGNGSGVPTFTSLSGDVTVNGTGVTAIAADSVALGTDTTGNYVATITNGNGISGSSGTEGGTPTIALGNLTADWIQGGAFDILLDNSSSELRILESGSSPSFYGAIDVGDLGADRTYTFPDATGIVCLSTGNCASSGGGVTTAGGTTGTLAVFTGAQTIGDSLLSQSGGTVTVDGNLDLTSGNQYQINGTQISSANLSNDANLAKLNASQTFTGNTVAFQNGSNSANAFNVQNAAGTRVLTVDTSAGQVELGTGSLLDGQLVFSNVSNNNTVTILPGTPTGNRTLTLPDASGIICTDSGNCAGAGATLQTAYNFSVGGTTPKIKVNSSLGAVDIQDADTTIGANLFNVRASNGLGLGSVMFGVASTGAVTLQNSANSTTALQLLTQGGTRVLTGDTQNGQVTLGQGGTLAGQLLFSNATNTNLGTLQTAALAQNTTYTLPDPAAGTATICLSTGNCAGSGGGVTTAGGTSGRLPVFNGAQTITNSWLLQNSSTLELDSSRSLTIQDGDLTLNNGGDILATGDITSNTFMQILESTGATFHGILDVGDLSADQTFTFLQGGTVVTSGNVSSHATTGVTAGAGLTGGGTTGVLTLDIGAGNGITANANDIALGSLTANWTQSGAFDILLDNASSELRILESAGATFYGTLDVGDLGADRTYTLPDATGTVCLSTGNCLGGASGGANTALSNLTSVAINTTLLPGAAGAIDLGSGALPFGDLYVAGTSGTPGTNNFRITGSSTGGTRTIILPDAGGTVCLQSSSACGFATGTAASYIQNQNAGQQSSSNFWISGTGRADTALQTPLLDTATAAALNIGTTNATVINLNENTTVAAAKTLTVTSGATSLTGATSGDALTVSNSTSTGNIAVFKDNSTDVATIADSGATTFKNSANSSAAFQIQNAAAEQMLGVDTTGTSIVVPNASLVTPYGGFGRYSNLLQYSEQFDNAAWIKSAALTVGADNATAPNYTTTADTITTSATNHNIRQVVSVSASTTYTFSWWAKAGTMSTVKYSVHDITNTTDLVAATSYTVGAGWQRFSVTFTTGSTTASVNIYPVRDSGVTGTVFLWGAQLEEFSSAGSYVSTQATTETSLHRGLTVNGGAVFKRQTDSTTAFRVLNASNVPLFQIDTSNNRLYVGNPTADTTGALLVLDNKDDAGGTTADPTGVNGGMYYNVDSAKFRCYEGGAWKDCIYSQPSSQTCQVATTFDNFATTGYEPTSTACEITFVAGSSGKAKIDMFARFDSDANDEEVNFDVEVRENNSSGTVVHSPTVETGAGDWRWNPALGAFTNHAAWRYLSGLTPGGTYWAQLNFDTAAIDVGEQSLLYTPLP